MPRQTVAVWSNIDTIRETIGSPNIKRIECNAGPVASPGSDGEIVSVAISRTSVSSADNECSIWSGTPSKLIVIGTFRYARVGDGHIAGIAAFNVRRDRRADLAVGIRELGLDGGRNGAESRATLFDR